MLENISRFSCSGHSIKYGLEWRGSEIERGNEEGGNEEECVHRVIMRVDDDLSFPTDECSAIRRSLVSSMFHIDSIHISWHIYQQIAFDLHPFSPAFNVTC